MERIYKMPNAVLLEWGDTIAVHMKEDIDKFTQFDAKLTIDVVNDLEQKVAKGYKEGGDEVNLAKLREKTEAVEQAMQDCRNYFKKLKYWVLDAFPGQKAIQRQFGIGRFRNITGNQARMILYMEGLEDTIKQHRVGLEAVQAPADLLDQSSILAKVLRLANKKQEQKKGTRTVDTEERIVHLNVLFTILQKINAAADNVFEDEPAKRRLYQQPSRKIGKDVTDDSTPTIDDEEE